MSEFISRNLTNQGLDLIASVLSDKSNALEFTKIQLGSGTYEGDTAEATSLVELRHTLQINKIERKGSNVILNASLIAKEIKESFYWKEIGVWAKGSDGKEILYLYSYTAKASYISAEMQNEKLIQLIAMVGNVENVKVTIDNSLVYLTKADLEPMLDELREKDKELKEEIDNLALQIGNISLDWDSIKGKPEKFPPEEHLHNASDIKGLPESLPANGGNADTVDGKHASDFALLTGTVTQKSSPLNANDCTENGVYHYWDNAGMTNFPATIGTLVVFCGASFPAQIFFDYLGNFWMRSRGAGVTEWSTWRRIYNNAYKPTCSDIGAAPTTHNHTWSSITGRPSTFPPATHAHAWADITGKPSTFPPATHNHPWADVTGKPSTFPPATHNHNWDSILNKPSVFSPAAHRHNASDINNVAYTYMTNGVDINDANLKQFYGVAVTGNSSAPNTDWWHILNIPHGDNNGYGGQIATGYHGNAGLQVRSANGTSWGPWYDIIGTIENLKRQLEGTMKPETIVKQGILTANQSVSGTGSGYIYLSLYNSSPATVTVDGTVLNHVAYYMTSSEGSSYSARIPYRSSYTITATNYTGDRHYSITSVT